MYIEKVEINGFLSFDHFKISLDRTLNIIVGSNGVGKSNFLHLINKVICDDKALLNDVNGTPNKYIKIYLKCDSVEEMLLLNNLHYFIFICNHDNQMQYVNFEDIKDELFRMKIFDDDSTIILSYEEGTFHSDGFVRKIRVDNKNYCYNPLNQNFIIEHTNEHIKTCSSDNCPMRKIKEISEKKEKKENVVSKTRIDDLKSYIGEIDKMLFNKIVNIIAISNPYSNYIQLCNTSQGIEESLFNYLKQILCNSFIETPITIDTVCDNIKKLRLNSKNKHDVEVSKQILMNISKEYQLRNQVLNIKNNVQIFNQIKNMFHKMTKKHFIIKMVNNHINSALNDCNYLVSQNKKGPYHNCSTGERELINFLVIYYGSSDNTIFLIDETCTKLSPQNKHNLKHVFSENKQINNYQSIIITHDSELIDPHVCNNVIYFRLDKSITECVELNKYNNPNKRCKDCGREKNQCQKCIEKIRLRADQIKLIYECPNALFAKKVLFVEGYTDYLFMKSFVNVFNVNDYEILILGGSGNKIWEILDELKIKYKILYDVDKITDIIRKCDCSLSFINNTQTHCNNCNKNIENNQKYYKIGNNTNKFIKRLNCNKQIKSNLIKNYNKIISNNTVSNVKDVSVLNVQIKNLIMEIKLHDKENKYFIWNGDIKDLEGISKILYGERFKSKEEWGRKGLDIKNKINENRYCKTFVALKKFLKS